MWLKGETSGLTIIEVMISVAVFAILAAGVSNTTLLTSRIAYSNVYENTAYMVAQGYAEQIKSIQHEVIRQALEDPVNFDIPTQSLSLGSGQNANQLRADDPLIFGVEMEKDVVVDLVDEDGEEVERTMQMWITATGQDLNASTDCWDAIEIAIDFQWEVFGPRGIHRQDGQVRLVKTNVSEF